jgi:hypothetical protein
MTSSPGRVRSRVSSLRKTMPLEQDRHGFNGVVDRRLGRSRHRRPASPRPQA